MDTEAQKRAEAAFAKKEQRAAEATSAWAEYKARGAAVDANTERLRALRLARDAQVAAPTPVSEKSKPKVRPARIK